MGGKLYFVWQGEDSSWTFSQVLIFNSDGVDYTSRDMPDLTGLYVAQPWWFRPSRDVELDALSNFGQAEDATSSSRFGFITL